MNTNLEIPKYTISELSAVENCPLNSKQLEIMLKRTPAKFKKQRPGKAGQVWDYVSGAYMKKVLNMIFGWNWDFEILNEQILQDEVVVKGKLTVRANGETIIKNQYGSKPIMRTKDGKYLSIGNDMKAAATDALKKCASELGIAGDVYGKEEFRDIEVVGSKSSQDIAKESEEARIKKLLSEAKTLKDLEAFEDVELSKEAMEIFCKKQSELQN